MLRFFRTNNPENLSDDELLDRYKKTADNAWLGHLYSRYFEMVFGVSLKIFKEKSAAEDAVMAIFEEILVKAKNHEIENFRGWLYVLARNHCLMELRKKSRIKTDLQPPEIMAKFDEAENPADFDLPKNENALQNCLETLKNDQKISVTAFYFEEKSYKEISEMMNLELGTVRSFIQNGRRMLKNCLENKGFVPENFSENG
jgi:RNA polymerase sigma factor (sigma-70 family)